jgi:hypothetical protein
MSDVSSTESSQGFLATMVDGIGTVGSAIYSYINNNAIGHSLLEMAGNVKTFVMNKLQEFTSETTTEATAQADTQAESSEVTTNTETEATTEESAIDVFNSMTDEEKLVYLSDMADTMSQSSDYKDAYDWDINSTTFLLPTDQIDYFNSLTDDTEKQEFLSQSYSSTLTELMPAYEEIAEKQESRAAEAEAIVSNDGTDVESSYDFE